MALSEKECVLFFEVFHLFHPNLEKNLAMDIMDDFLMNAVASNKKVGEAFCRRLLSVLIY